MHVSDAWVLGIALYEVVINRYQMLAVNPESGGGAPKEYGLDVANIAGGI